MDLTLFKLMSACNDLSHFITVPLDFPKANSLGLHLVPKLCSPTLNSNGRTASAYCQM